MVEIFSKAIHAIMTGKTVCAEGCHVGLGEGKINLVVASLAGVGCEGSDVAVMTILACEGESGRCLLVSS